MILSKQLTFLCASAANPDFVARLLAIFNDQLSHSHTLTTFKLNLSRQKGQLRYRYGSVELTSRLLGSALGSDDDCCRDGLPRAHRSSWWSRDTRRPSHWSEIMSRLPQNIEVKLKSLTFLFIFIRGQLQDWSISIIYFLTKKLDVAVAARCAHRFHSNLNFSSHTAVL